MKALALLLLAPALANAQSGSPRVLVMPFAVSVEGQAPGTAGAGLWLGEAASILLSGELPRWGFAAISREESAAAFERLQLPLSPALTRATMIRVAELLGATEIVFGDVRLGSELNVRARMISIAVGAERPDASDHAPLDQLFPLFDRVADRLATGSGRLGAPRAHAADAHPTLEVFESYVKGLVAPTPAAQRKFLETALKGAPHDPHILMALWNVYTALGVHDRALAVATSVPKDSTDARRARFRAALSLVELGRLDGAFPELQALYKERPSAVLSNELGVVQLRRGANASGGTASSFFARATTEDPGNADYLFNLGYAYAIARDSAAALQWLREAVRYDAANGDAHLVMSAVLVASGKSVEAQREFDLAKQLGASVDLATTGLSDKVPPKLERGRTELDLSALARLDAAIGNPAQRDQQEAAAFHLDRGRRLIEERNDRDAESELRRAIYLTPYADEPHMLLGKLYQRGGRVSEAVDEFKVAVWCKETAAARLALGEALLETGDREAARREAERAVALDPNSAPARALLRKIGGNPVLPFLQN